MPSADSLTTVAGLASGEVAGPDAGGGATEGGTDEGAGVGVLAQAARIALVRRRAAKDAGRR